MNGESRVEENNKNVNLVFEKVGNGKLGFEATVTVLLSDISKSLAVIADALTEDNKNGKW